MKKPKAAQSSNPTAGAFSLRLEKKSWETATGKKVGRDVAKNARHKRPSDRSGL